MELAKRDEAIEKAEIAKLAADVLEGHAGDDDTHAYIVKAIRKGGGDAAMIEKALTSLRSVKPLAKSAAVAKGVSTGDEPKYETAVAELDGVTAKYMADHKVDRPTARVAVLKTAEGKHLYAKSVGRA
jgi:hypothetical protein